MLGLCLQLALMGHSLAHSAAEGEVRAELVEAAGDHHRSVPPARGMRNQGAAAPSEHAGKGHNPRSYRYSVKGSAVVSMCMRI